MKFVVTICAELMKNVAFDVNQTVGQIIAESESISSSCSGAADEAVDVSEVSFHAAIRGEIVAFNMDALKLYLRFNKQLVSKIKLPAAFKADTVEVLLDVASNARTCGITDGIVAVNDTAF